MFAIIYRFKLKPDQEAHYKEHWRKVADYFTQKCGAIGSCLHRGKDGLWVAYSRWPDRATRDAAWPGDDDPSSKLPPNIQEAIKQIQALKQQNKDLEQYDDICLDVVDDLLLNH